jgi:hypothetical protein
VTQPKMFVVFTVDKKVQHNMRLGPYIENWKNMHEAVPRLVTTNTAIGKKVHVSSPIPTFAF